MRTNITTIVMALLSGSALALQAPSLSPERRARPSGLGQAHRPLQMESAVASLLDRAAQAEATGDPKQAEDLYRRAIANRPDLLLLRTRLARFYDRSQRDHDAFVEYRALVVGRPDVWCSDQEDPIVLARLGDLSAKFETLDSAKRAYASAATRSDRDDRWEPAPTPRNASLGSLKAAAHVAAALRYCGTGDRGNEIRELEASIAADKAYWVSRFYLARAYKRVGRREEASYEADEAHRLATTDRCREMVLSMRTRHGI